MGAIMTRITAFLAAALVSLPLGAGAEPIKLKAATFASDRTATYFGGIKPFVDAVNAEARGEIEIEVYSSGALGKDLSQQWQMVRDGIADFGFIIPGYTPDQFTDNGVIELPGMFKGLREATLVYNRLVASSALSGYEDLVVIGAYATDAEVFHTRAPVAKLDDLKGMKLRTNNPMEAAAVAKLGMSGFHLPINQIAQAIGSGKIDGALLPPMATFEYGISRIATHHYMLPTSTAPLAFVMNRSKFESLPPHAKSIIRKYSGEWTATHFIEIFEAGGRRVTAQLRSDPDRTVVMPSPADLATAQRVFAQVADEWVASSPQNKALVRAVKDELGKLRAVD
jgi:TRAP-type C4-dicarboxylate transport system substrate-binding protein